MKRKREERDKNGGTGGREKLITLIGGKEIRKDKEDKIGK